MILTSRSFTSDSSVIKSVREDNSDLIIELQSGKQYRYHGAAEVFDTFEGAPSYGVFYNQRIKPVYPCDPIS